MGPCKRANIPGLVPPGALSTAKSGVQRAAERGERKGNVGGVLSAEGGGGVGGGGASGDGAKERVIAVAEGRKSPCDVGTILRAAFVQLSPVVVLRGMKGCEIQMALHLYSLALLVY